MKQILVVLLALLISFVAVAEQVTVDTKDLTPEQISKIKSEEAAQSIQQKVQQYGNWVGLGKELGTAVNESLTTVEDHADKIANTKVGKFTLIMVAWKVIGKDVANYVWHALAAICEVLLFVPYYIWLLQKNGINHRVLVKKNADGSKEWKNIEVNGEQQAAYIYVGFGLVFILLFTWFSAG